MARHNTFLALLLLSALVSAHGCSSTGSTDTGPAAEVRLPDAAGDEVVDATLPADLPGLPDGLPDLGGPETATDLVAEMPLPGDATDLDVTPLPEVVDLVPGELPAPDLPPEEVAPQKPLGQVTGACTGDIAQAVAADDAAFLTNTYTFDEAPAFDSTLLSPGALKRYEGENSGGSSLCSEVMSIQLLNECEGATLYKTEKEVLYTTEGKITDFIILLDGDKVGVSVTRAYKGPMGDTYTATDAEELLTKKLQGIVESTANVAPEDAWVKQILHVWTLKPDWVPILETAYEGIDDALKADTVVLVTVEANATWIVPDDCGAGQ